MRFKKIRWNGTEVELIWTTKESGAEIEHTLKSEQEPSNDFILALEAFEPLVLKLLDLPPAYEDGLRVTTLAISETKDARGLVISATKKLEGTNAPLNLHTPHRRSKREEGQADAAGLISDDMQAALDEAERCAQRYVNGDRSQTELPLEGGSVRPSVKREMAGAVDREPAGV